ncbi:MAG: type II CRISPR RNA-guided endonuclease Cas9, partial [Clostridium sp.]
MRYSIGIDLGTDANGIAVITNELKLVKYKRRNAWSVLKFEGGKTAEKRRSYRNSRRRLKRRKIRITNLRMLLESEILKIDPTFFLRLEEAFMYKEDRKNNDRKYNLFTEKKYNDRDFYRENRTIYHLREKLINEKEKFDIRLIYLAIHHIIKYRGHFIYEGEEFSKDSLDNNELFNELLKMCKEHLEIDVKPLNQIEILESDKKSRKDKVNELISLEKYGKDEKVILKQIYNGVLGLTMDTKKLFKDYDLGEIKSLKMDEDELENKVDGLSNIVEEKVEVINIIKKLYSGIKLKEILGDSVYISSAMVKKYKKFHQQLKTLKYIIKNYCSEQDYDELFKGDEKKDSLHEDYIELSKGDEKKNSLYEDYLNNKYVGDNKNLFFEKIKKLIGDLDTEDSNKIIKEIDMEAFLIKQNTKANGAIPYQVHLQELKAILENQGEYYEILKENTDKIIQLLTFKIPYYVGPIGKNQAFGWMKRKDGCENEKIYPWNFKEVVDLEKSAELFITQMTNYCSYVYDKPVIPFNSIVYTEYLYYNEVNKIRFNDNLLDPIEKEALKKQLFMKQNNVTKKDLEKWYRKRNGYTKENKVVVTGFMGEEKASVTLKPIRDFVDIFGKITESNINDIEKIIRYITLFEDKKILELKLDNEFKFTEVNKKKIMGLNYKGWGRISYYVLNGLKSDKGKYRGKTILEILKETNLNFMQIINDNNIGFNKLMEEENGSDTIQKINYDDHIKPLQGSPALKKGVYQGVKQIEEIIKLMGCTPENIFVEVAKSDEKSIRTLARNKKLLELYGEIQDLEATDKEIIKKLKDSKFKINNERLYLYCIQRGKCMYSGKPLEIDQLYNYEVDHIIPRSLIKDNSMANKALVLKFENQRKANGALEDKIINNRREFWKQLYDCRLISKIKYQNLINNSGIFDEEVEKGFLNRQLVEVRQITKHVVNLLNRAYGHRGTKVYAIKAELVDNFKKQFDINKSREINDLHHAKDAYAVAVVGSYVKRRFPSLDKEFIYEEYKEYRKEYKGKGKYGFIL